MPFFKRRSPKQTPPSNQDAHQAYLEAVAPEAVEEQEDALRFPHGFLLPFTVREVIAKLGYPNRPLSRIRADALFGPIPHIWSVTVRRATPDTLVRSIRARRTLMEGALIALQEKIGRRPSSAEMMTDRAMDQAESALALGEPAYDVGVVAGIFAKDREHAEYHRRELETRLRSAGLIPQRFQFVAIEALRALQPGGPLFHSLTRHTVFLKHFLGLLPTPHYRPQIPDDAVRLGYHQRTGSEVFFSFTSGFDPNSPPPPNSTTLILGEPGSGKTTTMRLIFLQRLLQGRTIVTVDPEGEYNNLCLAMGGTLVRAGVPEDPDTCLLHPLQAKTMDDLFLSARFLISAVAGDNLDSIANAALSQVIQRLWGRTPPDERGIRSPSVMDLVEALELSTATIPQAASLAAVLRPYARGGLLEGFFDRPRALLQADVPKGTWVNFDLSALREENRHLVHAIMTWYFYHIITVGREPVDVYIDEGWRLLREGPFSDLLDELGRRARKRGVGVVLVTHLPGDLARTGGSILTLASHTLIGRLGSEDAYAYLRAGGISDTQAQALAQQVATLPPHTFIAAPSGGRGGHFPVLVDVPKLWLEVIEMTSPFAGMQGTQV